MKRQPGAFSRAVSAAVIAATGLASKTFLYGTQRTEVLGLSGFLKLQEARRQGVLDRGLLTASNHKSILDDPLMWGTLPTRMLLSPSQMRHALGSADICFTNPASMRFFALGQVHPTFRLHKSALGGLFQPTLNRLPTAVLSPPDAGWVHIFPEGRIHQHPSHQMRYFKWGVSRLLLEPVVAPVFVPMFISGFEEIMSESRTFPRFLPRVGKKVRIVYGDAVPDSRFEDVREAWHKLWMWQGCVRVEDSEELRSGKEAVELRIETTRRVREEIIKLRRRLGYPDEEPGAGDPETYHLPGMEAKDGTLSDGSMVKDS